MSIPILLFGGIILVMSIFMFIKARKKKASLEKYEFENRSADGVVKFGSLELSRMHAADKGLNNVIGIVGVVVGLLGVIVLAVGLGL